MNHENSLRHEVDLVQFYTRENNCGDDGGGASGMGRGKGGAFCDGMRAGFCFRRMQAEISRIRWSLRWGLMGWGVDMGGEF